jgi:hypothetical protein
MTVEILGSWGIYLSFMVAILNLFSIISITITDCSNTTEHINCFNLHAGRRLWAKYYFLGIRGSQNGYFHSFPDFEYLDRLQYFLITYYSIVSLYFGNRK